MGELNHREKANTMEEMRQNGLQKWSLQSLLSRLLFRLKRILKKTEVVANWELTDWENLKTRRGKRGGEILVAIR